MAQSRGQTFQRTAPALAAILVVLAGCGDMSRGELERRVEALESMAAEGELLAGEVASDRTKTTFARVRARELADDADHEAEKMADATPAAGLGDARDDAVEQAQALADAFGALQIFPGDEGRGAQVERTLREHARQLSSLLERL